jgi:hypothetical protein
MIDNSTENLDPVFKAKVEKMWQEFRANWLDCFIFEWRRSFERQCELFWKWRSATTCKRYWVPIRYANPSAKIVTWTLQSKHLEWKAIDIVFDANSDPKIKVPRWSWNYPKLIEIAKKYWIRNLAPLETCHFEI